MCVCVCVLAKELCKNHSGMFRKLLAVCFLHAGRPSSFLSCYFPTESRDLRIAYWATVELS